MKKKILMLLIAILTLVSVLALASCGGGNGGTEQFTVTFDTSLSLEGKGAVPSQTVAKGGKVIEPDIELTRYNSTFDGWYLDKEKWDFENDVVTQDITLKAKFKGQALACEHDFQETERKNPTCKADGYYVETCTKCRLRQRITKAEDPSLAKLEHIELTETVEPTCGTKGYTRVYCENGCGLNDVREIDATGEHKYETFINADGQEELKWNVTLKPTKYATGSRERTCTFCGGAKITEILNYEATPLDLSQLSIVNFRYTGGKYENEPFVNVASYGRVTVSSYYTICMGHLINDGDLSKYWTADTYADGSDYTEDYFEMEWDKEYEIGALRFVLPYYSSYDLGDDCYVSYNLYYWDSTASDYVFIKEISDKEGTKSGLSCEVMYTFAEPVTTSKIRAEVTHAGRYTPATVYEMEAYAKTAEKQRVPANAVGGATVSISGKYNDWVAGADAITDNSTASYWTTNAKGGTIPWAMYEYSKETFIASVQFTTKAHAGRQFILEFWLQEGENPEDGKWIQIGQAYTVPDDAGKASEDPFVIKYGYDEFAKDQICTFNVDVEVKTTKIKLSIIKEPIYWESWVYDFIPYTVNELAKNENKTVLCTHKNPSVVKVDYTDEYGNLKQKELIIEPTCVDAGYKQLRCSCGHEMTSYATDALGHSFGEYTVKSEATIEKLGVKHASCANCDAVREYNYSYGTSDLSELATITDYFHNANGAWAQSFDDGNYVETYEWVVPMLLKYNYRATTVMSITYGEGLVKEWSERFSTGAFDLGSHSYNHTSIYAATANPSGLLKEVVDAQYWFRATFPGQKVLVFAAPLGATSNEVADYLTGPMAANRNGGQTGAFINTIEQLEERKTAGNSNTWVSKADQSEGTFVLIDKDKTDYTYRKVHKQDETTGEYLYDEENKPIYEYAYVKGGYVKTGSTFTFNENGGEYALLPNIKGEYVYAEKSKNLVYSEEDGTFVSVGVAGGSYYFDASSWKYEFKGTGGYTDNGDGTFTYSDSGKLVLIKTSVGTYEEAINKLVEAKGWTIECIHSLGAGSIYSSFESTISKFEYLKLKGVWACSYNEIVQYRKEASSAVLNLVEQTDNKIVLSLEDSLDNFMFNQALTIKVKLPNGWSNVSSVAQGENAIEGVTMADYMDDMTKISYTIEDGYLYLDAIPDCGNIVITK